MGKLGPGRAASTTRQVTQPLTLVSPPKPLGVLERGHAGLVMNKLSLGRRRVRFWRDALRDRPRQQPHSGASPPSPEPETLNPEPHTLNPEPCTLHPPTQSLNPQPSTLNLETCGVRRGRAMWHALESIDERASWVPPGL